MHEVLDPGRLDIRQELASGFAGMTDEPVAIDSLHEARERLIAELVGGIPSVTGASSPASWKARRTGACSRRSVRELPSVRWRMMNLEKLTPARRRELIDALQAALGS